MDLRLSKRITLTGPLALDLIVEAFNLLDRTNFSEINSIFGTGAFPTNPLPLYGRYEQDLGPRQVQLAAKLSF